MTTGPNNAQPKNLVRAILSDVHFWIPAIVLLAGLWVLHWIR